MESVCNQSLHEIEVICVNDCSSDDSATVLREYTSRDNRLLSITFSRNQGVSAARNVGMTVAGGQWLGFVDSDDGIAPDFYEKLVSAASNDTQIVKGSVWTENNAPHYINADLNKRIRENKLNFTYEWTSCIYRTSFIRNNRITFLQGCSNGEDVAFLYDAVLHASSIEVIDDAIYNYFHRDESSDSSFYTSKNIPSLLMMLESLVHSLNTCIREIDNYTSEFRRLLYRCTLISQRVHPNEASILQPQIASAFLQLFEECRHKKETLASFHEGVADAIRAKDVAALVQHLSLSPQALSRERILARWRAHRSQFHPALRTTLPGT